MASLGCGMDIGQTRQRFQTYLYQLDKSIYIGVTESPIWRWELCRDHTDTDMKAHGDHYEKMFVLCVCGLSRLHPSA